jgi:hypothetical protein
MHDILRMPSTIALVTMFAASAAARQHPSMPAGMSHEQHLKQMKDDELKKRGAAAMGFDQDTTSHHFLLAPDGGSIEVGVNDPADEEGRTAVRAHLKEIAAEFSRGVFDKPFATHGEVPPGVSAMRRLRKAIRFRFEEAAAGGRVRISTDDAKARDAVHEFLRYQIREHGTGDPLQD